MNIIFEDNFAIDTNDTEIDYKRTSSMFHGLDGDIAYPFTIPTTPKTAHKLGFPNLMNVSRKTANYPVRFKHGNFQIAKGNLKIRTGNSKNISADFTTTPGGIPKNIWNKKLNEFDVGTEVIPTAQLPNTIYGLTAEDMTGIYNDPILGGSTGPINLKNSILNIFFETNIKFSIGSQTLIDKTFRPSSTDLRNSSFAVNLFQDIIAEYNVANTNHCTSSHASLTSSPESRTSNRIQSMVLVAVGEYSSVVLRTQVGLDTLALSRRARVDVLSRLVAAHKAYGLDTGLVDDEVDGLGRTVHDVDDTCGEASLLSKLSKDHAGAGIAF